jgi:hypothetical protein
LQQALLRTERVEPCLGRINIGFDLAHLRCSINQLLVEFAAILTERLDFSAQLGLGLR